MEDLHAGDQCSFNGHWTFRGPKGREERCYLQIYSTGGALPVVLVADITEHPDESISDAVAAVATHVWSELLAHALEGFRVVVIQRRRVPPGYIEERFAEVSLITHGNRLAVTGWLPSSRAQVEVLIRSTFSLPIPLPTV